MNDTIVSPYTGVIFNAKKQPINDPSTAEPQYLAPPNEGDEVTYAMQDGLPLAYETTYDSVKKPKRKPKP